MRIMALDVGQRRIGVAVSDELGLCAHPLTTLARKGNLRDSAAIAHLVDEMQVSELVLGYPLDGDGTVGVAARRIERFAELLRSRLAMPIHLHDERFTTVEAERVLIEANLSREKRRRVVDRAAAARILKEFMEAREAAKSQP